jgi:AcrR family transcriptional regulator
MASNTTLETIRKNQIIDAALRIIGERGAYNVTMDDIASAAEMSKGGVAHYFSSKEALFLEAVKVFYDRIFERGKETRDQFEDPLEKLLSFTWLYNWDDQELMMGYRLLFDFQTLAAHDDRYNLLYHEWVENWIRLLKDAIEEGVRRRHVFRQGCRRSRAHGFRHLSRYCQSLVFVPGFAHHQVGPGILPASDYAFFM